MFLCQYLNQYIFVLKMASYLFKKNIEFHFSDILLGFNLKKKLTS